MSKQDLKNTHQINNLFQHTTHFCATNDEIDKVSNDKCKVFNTMARERSLG